MRHIQILIILAAAFMVGCASNPMQVAPSQEVVSPDGDQAQVVFMRSSFVGSAISASLYDVTEEETKFIGILANGTKIAYDSETGERVFMVVAESADFMEADLAGGKTYYSVVTPRMGVWKARFSMWPIKNDPDAEYQLESGDVKEWIESTKLVINSEKSRQWFENNKSNIEAKRQKYWTAWQEKTDAQIEERSLDPDDGR